jgi:hydrogenase nickel incorporation protein HypA/HybF
MRSKPVHELALSQSIVDAVLLRAQQEGMHSVTRVVLELGTAAGVERAALSFCFDAVTRATAAEGADLEIETVPLRGRCRACHREFEPAGLISPCPSCGAYAPIFTAGRELRVKSFEGE